jgi:hypothetical protein
MYRAICGTYVNSSPAGGPSSHPTPGRGEGVPCTPQANAPVLAATSAGSYSVPTSRVNRKFTARAASRSRGTLRGRAAAGHDGPGSSVSRPDRNGPEGPAGPAGSRPGSPWTGSPESSGGLAGHARRAERPGAEAWARGGLPGCRLHSADGAVPAGPELTASGADSTSRSCGPDHAGPIMRAD